MVITLTDKERNFIMTVMETAERSGIQCELSLIKPELIDGKITVSTKDTEESRNIKIKGMYHTLERNGYDPTVADLIEFMNRSSCDSNGWIPLFITADEDEDCRWYIRIVREDKHRCCGVFDICRKEDGQLSKVCMCTYDHNTLVIYNPDHKDDCKPYPGKTVISSISKDVLHRLMGYNGILVAEVLIDFLKNRHMKADK